MICRADRFALSLARARRPSREFAAPSRSGPKKADASLTTHTLAQETLTAKQISVRRTVGICATPVSCTNAMPARRRARSARTERATVSRRVIRVAPQCCSRQARGAWKRVRIGRAHSRARVLTCRPLAARTGQRMSSRRSVDMLEPSTASDEARFAPGRTGDNYDVPGNDPGREMRGSCRASNDRRRSRRPEGVHCRRAIERGRRKASG